MNPSFSYQAFNVLRRVLFIIAMGCHCSWAEAGILKRFDPLDLHLVLDSTALKIPGSACDFGLLLTTREGEVLCTRGLLKGALRWNQFDITALGADVAGGKLHFRKNDPRIQAKVVELKVALKKHPGFAKTFRIPLNYGKAIRILPLENFKKSPGQKIKLRTAIEYDNGRTIFINQPAQQRELMNFEVSGGRFENSVLKISENPLEIDYHTVKLKASLKDDPSVFSSWNIVLDYRMNFLHYVSGSSGMNGFSGFSGSSGSTGQPGRDGDPGRDGEDGSPGPELQVFATAYYDELLAENLLMLRIIEFRGKKAKFYLINPDGGSIRIVSAGGDGGNGGSGGSGGNGGDGAEGELRSSWVKVNDSTTALEYYRMPGAQGGNGGYGGPGGFGGAGGNGGYIELLYTPAAIPYLSGIQLSCPGGSGGWGGSGGSAGRGGSGGSGEPDGASGQAGMSGSSGQTGDSGDEGEYEKIEIPEEEYPWPEQFLKKD